jgi:outer membrane protein assembly factor BamB
MKHGAVPLLALLLAACGDGGDATRDSGQPTLDAGHDAMPPPPGCLYWQVDRQWGTTGEDTAGVVISADGDLALFGYQGGTAGATIAPGGDATGYLERFDPAGARRWHYQLATPGTDVIDAALLTADGALVAGRIQGGERLQFELQVASLDAAGAERWRHGAGTLPPERATAIASSGDLHVVGGYQDLYIPTNYVETWEDPFVFAWRGDDAAAGAFWRFGTEGSDVGGGVLIDGDGSHALLAVSVLDGVERGGHVARFDLATGGHELVPINPGGLETASALRRLPDGDLLVAGSTVRVLGPISHGEQDGFVARYDAALTTRRWVAQIGTAASEVITAVAVGADGNIYAAGETLGAFDATTPNQGATDVFVVALAPDGSERWRWQRGTPGDDGPTHVAVDACENVIVSGATAGALAGAALGGRDAFAMRASAPAP